MDEEFTSNGLSMEERAAFGSFPFRRGDVVSYSGVAGYIVRGIDPMHDSLLISKPGLKGSAARVRVAEVVPV